jgi:hypothetical protein
MQAWQLVIGNRRGVVDRPGLGALDIITAPTGWVAMAELYPVPPQGNRSLRLAGQRSPQLTGDEEYDAKLLATDLRVALHLLNRARAVAAARVFGVPEDKSMLVSVIAAGLLAQAAYDRGRRYVTAPVGLTVGDVAIGMTALREASHWITGDRYKDTPIFGSLVALAVAAKVIRPAVRESSRRIKNASQSARAGFDRMYGELFGR